MWLGRGGSPLSGLSSLRVLGASSPPSLVHVSHGPGPWLLVIHTGKTWRKGREGERASERGGWGAGRRGLGGGT